MQFPLISSISEASPGQQGDFIRGPSDRRGGCNAPRCQRGARPLKRNVGDEAAVRRTERRRGR